VKIILVIYVCGENNNNKNNFDILIVNLLLNILLMYVSLINF